MQELTTGIAVYAALVATAGLCWQIYSWRSRMDDEAEQARRGREAEAAKQLLTELTVALKGLPKTRTPAHDLRDRAFEYRMLVRDIQDNNLALQDPELRERFSAMNWIPIAAEQQAATVSRLHGSSSGCENSSPLVDAWPRDVAERDLKQALGDLIRHEEIRPGSLPDLQELMEITNPSADQQGGAGLDNLRLWLTRPGSVR